MRRLRFHAPDHLVEITSRTLHGRLLLRPGAVFNDIFLGILGRAQERFAMEIQFAVALSNHYHLLLRPRDHHQLSAFMSYLNGNLAKEVGRMYGWKEKIWGRRYQGILVSDEPDAQVKRLRYLLAHGVKEGLVSRVADWPGPNFLEALLDGKPLQGTWFDRTAEGRARRRGELVGACDHATPQLVVLSPLPCWQSLSKDEHRAAVLSLVADVEAAAAADRVLTGRAPLGAREVLRQAPHQVPFRAKRSPAPWFHTASRGALLALKAAYSAFMDQYRAAASALRKGGRRLAFPPGSFPPAPPWVRA
jgi:hypothetical protein